MLSDTEKSRIFVGISILIHVVYFGIFAGLTFLDGDYIRWLSTAVQIFVGVFLAYRFNPLVRHTQTIRHFDRQIIFSSAVFMLINTLATELFTIVRGALR